jgi:hypothetical protein
MEMQIDKCHFAIPLSGVKMEMQIDICHFVFPSYFSIKITRITYNIN